MAALALLVSCAPVPAPARPAPAGDDAASGPAAPGAAPADGTPPSDGDTARPTRARVVAIVDGDTIDVARIGGPRLPSARVRLIGVDTPEVHGRVEAYGREASAFTRRHLAGRVVWLERDVSETDRYGRALRYVWLVEPPAEPAEGDVRAGMYNALLVLEGYAQVYTLPPDVRYAELFLSFQREARAAGRGLWGEAAGEGGGAGAGGAEAAGAGAGCDPSYPDVCIPPPPPDLDCGDVPHRRFRVQGDDPHRFDRDGDGVGCE